MYATVSDIEARMTRTLTEAERSMAETLIEDAAVLIDAYSATAASDRKKVVTCRMVIRAIGADNGVPLGTTQGSISALGYSQSWQLAGGTGELYLGRTEKQLLGGSKIGSKSPVEDTCEA